MNLGHWCSLHCTAHRNYLICEQCLYWTTINGIVPKGSILHRSWETKCSGKKKDTIWFEPPRHCVLGGILCQASLHRPKFIYPLDLEMPATGSTYCISSSAVRMSKSFHYSTDAFKVGRPEIKRSLPNNLPLQLIVTREGCMSKQRSNNF